MTFFFDNNFSKKIVESLKANGEDVTHLQDEFPQNTPDTVWLPEIGQRQWIIVTLDRKITRRPAERLALDEANVTAVFIHKGFFQMRAQEQLWWITVRWSIIKTAATGAEQGTKLSLTMDGDIKPM